MLKFRRNPWLWRDRTRAVQEVLLVDRLQDHGDRPLKHFVFAGRNPEGTGLGDRAGLGDVDPTHGRGDVRAGLGSVQERWEVALPVRLIVLAGLSVHADGPSFAGAVVGLVEPEDVDECGARGLP